jgi:Na+/glutamate symporter
MSQQNGFGNGFVLGSLVGGIVGGILGTVLVTRKEKQIDKTDYQLQKNQEMPFSTEESIELARHGLEDKIAQLNLAIDDVRQQLGTVKASSEQD